MRTNALSVAACVAVIGGAALGLTGCGSRGGASTRFVDHNPLPLDTMTVPVPSIGTYGGRFVIGETNPPKTFNAMMANETSSTDITNRLFAGLAGYDNVEQRLVPELAKSWETAA